jgi:hypothetical protein
MSSREEVTAGLAEILEEVAGVNPDDVAEAATSSSPERFELSR